MSNFVIEKNVPMIAAKSCTKSSLYPFREMEIGDSFFVAGDNAKKVASAANSFTRGRGEYRFSVRTVTENGVKGARVWRIAVNGKGESR